MTVQALEHESYISLKTFRKNGEGVPTPVWFALDAGKLYVLTEETSGKAKRIRNTTRVEIAPCDGRGKLKAGAAYSDAQAHILPANQNAYVDDLLLKKYGFIKRVFALMGRLRGAKYICLEITQ